MTYQHIAEKLRGTSKNTKVKIGLTEVDTCILHVGMIVCMSIFYHHNYFIQDAPPVKEVAPVKIKVKLILFQWIL